MDEGLLCTVLTGKRGKMMNKLPIALLFILLFISMINNSAFSISTLPNSSQTTNIKNDDQWGIRKINAPRAWRQGVTGGGITVAVIDTGIDYTNKDLSDHIGSGIDIVTNSTDTADIQDTNGHGTHVASIIGGNGKGLGIMGVAPSVTLMPIKVTTRSGNVLDTDVAKGIKWAADNGADIINISMGQSHNPQYLQDAVRYAQDKGCLLVAASGNHYNTPNPGVLYPAAEPGVLAVSAIDSQSKIADFANTGQQVALTAPGVHIAGDRITNVYSYIGYADGTSIAAPFVSGSAALLWSAHRVFIQNQVAILLEQSAVDLGLKGRDGKYGFGLPDVERALRLADIKKFGFTSTVDFIAGILKSNQGQQDPAPFIQQRRERVSPKLQL